MFGTINELESDPLARSA